MKKIIILLAIILINMNFISCTKSDLAEEENLIENATEGDNEQVYPDPEDDEDEG